MYKTGINFFFFQKMFFFVCFFFVFVRLHNTLNCRAYTKGEKFQREGRRILCTGIDAQIPRPKNFKFPFPKISFCFPSFYVIISFKNCGGGGGIQMGCVKNFGHVLHAQQHLSFFECAIFESSRREKQINLKIQKMVTGHGGNNTRIFFLIWIKKKQKTRRANFLWKLIIVIFAFFFNFVVLKNKSEKIGGNIKAQSHAHTQCYLLMGGGGGGRGE